MPFQTNNRADISPKRATETSFGFLDRSARPEIGRVRNYLADAINNYPLEAREELVTRLRSGNETHFRSASFEVLLHEGLRRMGFALTPHPDPGTGSAKRPDFLVTAPDGSNFYLEAVLASERNGASPAAEARKQTTLDLLDGSPHKAFLLDVENNGDPNTQPSGRDLARFAHAWLDTLNPDELVLRLAKGGMDQMPSTTWVHEGWEVGLRAIPVSPERRGNLTRLIGIMGSGAAWVNNWEPLRDAVRNKANRYGKFEKPFVVAVNTNSFHLSEIDEAQALFGEEVWVEYHNHPEFSGMQRNSNGAWFGPHGPQNKRVSAVWFFNDLTPYTIANRRSTMYLNPWANIQMPESFGRFPKCMLDGESLVRVDGVTLREVFGLPDGWPE